VEYVIAFDVGRHVEDIGDCSWAGLTDQTRADRIQAEIVRAHPAGGDTIGYKVTIADEGPAISVLTGGMLLSNESIVDLMSGRRLRGDASLLLRVASADINQASNLQQVAANVDVVIPVIDSSDSLLADDIVPTRVTLTAINGDSRWLVLGDEVNVSGLTPGDKVRMLSGLRAEFLSSSTSTLVSKDLAGRNPLQSVLDVMADLQRRDAGELKKGDLIATGTFGAPYFPQSGETLRVIYHGLTDREASVAAVFR
jgi:2-keto-4-pentenoate hydratase